MTQKKPNVIDRLRESAKFFRNGSKSAPPMMWPTWENGKPKWQLVDYESFAKDGFSRNSLIYSAIMYKVRAMSQAQLRAFSNDYDNPTRLPMAHPLSKLVFRPNKFQSWLEFQALNDVYLNIAGNSYIYLERTIPGQLPTRLYSLRPDRVFIIPDGKTVRGYLYVPEGKTKEQGIPILADDLLHVKLPNPMDPLEGMGYGLSPIAAMAESGDVDNSITSFLKIFFDKGVQLAGVLKFNTRLEPETVQQIKERWSQTYGGMENWGTVGVLDQEGEYQRISPTFEEMGFETVDDRNESRILGPFGVPMILIGGRFGLKHATYSNYELARKAFWEDTFIPELRLFENEFEYTLNDGKAFVRFDLSKVPALQQDIPKLVDSAHKLWAMGTPLNLAIRAVGLRFDEIPGGNVGYVQQGYLPVIENSTEVIDDPPPSQENEDGGGAKQRDPFGFTTNLLRNTSKSQKKKTSSEDP